MRSSNGNAAGNGKGQKEQFGIVFKASAALTIIVAAWAIISGASFEASVAAGRAFIGEAFSWVYLYGVLGFVIFGFVLAFSKYGKVRLGKDDEKPSLSTGSWMAMLFAAGMGIGLVFWGVAEPIYHYVGPMAPIVPQSEDALRFAIRSTFMHWGVHPWGLYMMMGLGLGLVMFRYDKRALCSNIFSPILGDGAPETKWGRFFDIYTVVLGAIGVAMSFGMGVKQICGGMNLMFGLPMNNFVYFVVIAVICAIYTAAATTGIEKGMKYVSNFNMVVFGLVMLIMLWVSPAREVIINLSWGIRDYIINFFPDSVRLSALSLWDTLPDHDPSWVLGWRVYYWAWWQSWVPFVGIFLARISKGRTIREFVLGTLLMPTVVSCVWFCLNTTAATNVAEQMGGISAISAIPAEEMIFKVFGQYATPGTAICIGACILTITFFITSADAACYVLAMSSSDGNPEPSNTQKAFWGIMCAVIAYALVLAGGVPTIMNVAIASSAPYMVMLLMMIWMIPMLLSQEKAGGLKK